MTESRRVVLTTSSATYGRDELDQLPGIRLVERYDLGNLPSEQELADALNGAWAVIAGSERYTEGVFRATPGLRAIVRWGTGSDAVDLRAASQAGVAVVTAPGANADAVADMALALMLSVLRSVPGNDAAVRAGRWQLPGISRDLTRATVAIVGLGAVGRAVARRLRGFGCRTLAVEPNPDLDFCRSHGVELAGLDQVLPQADVVTLHAPLTESTRGIITARELGLLPAHAVLINTSRGQLVDQTALVAALRDRVIAGAGLDVFEQEPLPEDDPLTTLPNVVLSGHVSSSTRLGMQRTAAAVVANLRELLDGRTPASCLNPQAWAQPVTEGGESVG